MLGVLLFILCLANAVLLWVLINAKELERIIFKPFLSFFRFKWDKPDTLRIFFHFKLCVCNEVRLHCTMFGYGFNAGFLWYDVACAIKKLSVVTTNEKKSQKTKEMPELKIIPLKSKPMKKPKPIQMKKTKGDGPLFTNNSVGNGVRNSKQRSFHSVAKEVINTNQKRKWLRQMKDKNLKRFIEEEFPIDQNISLL